MADINVKLPRLTRGWQDQPQLLERYWDIAMRKIESSLNQLLAIPIIQEALVDLDDAIVAAETAAENAQSAADNAQASANGVTAETSLANSYINNFVAPLISADNLGNVTIANHDRVYGDGSTVSVIGVVLNTGETSPDILRVYYEDVDRLGGSVTYLYTVDPTPPPAQTGSTHSVGATEIPAAGSQDGDYVRPPGFVDLR